MVSSVLLIALSVAAPPVEASGGVNVFGHAKPLVESDPDSGKVELGVQFRASRAGSISGIRFYKG